MDETSIFLPQTSDNNISGKITYTNIMETIPSDKLESSKEGWNQLHKTEWRWRFIKLPPSNKLTVEISYINHDSDKRIYFNKHGDWVERKIPQAFDSYVVKEYYYYSDY